jgi:hypothetical protein
LRAAEANFDIVEHPRPGKQPRLLEHHADVLVPGSLAKGDGAGIARLQPRNQAEQRALAAAAAPDDGDELAGRDMQVDAAKHLVVAEGFAQAADGQRQAGMRSVRLPAQRPRLFDEIAAIEHLGAGAKLKSFLHGLSQRFWKAGCQESVSRSRRRERLSASLPSRA